MKPPRFATQPVDASFFDRAPLRLSDTMDIPRPAAKVWDELTRDSPLTWCRILNAVTWTSARPLGVGSTRTVKSLGGAMMLEERFFRWEEGRRQSFFVYETSAPLFTRFAEDFLVEPSADATCRLAWTIAVEPRPVARPGNPINRMIFKTLFRDTRKHFGAS